MLDEARGRLYVTTRFDNSVKVIDTTTRAQVAAVTLPNPEPAVIVQGRPKLYDATVLSANGEASCASCHIFGDVDDLAWDLGNPDDVVTHNPLPKNLTSDLEIGIGKVLFGVRTPINGSDDVEEFHPMKGPMTTQTLRGLRNSGAMHWRGDRATGHFGSDPLDANLSFNNFIVAFEGLVGRDGLPSTADMQSFTNFQLKVLPPPNPVRALDNSLNAAQTRGRNFYVGSRPSDGIDIPILGGIIPGDTAFNCEGCHRLDPSPGLFRHRRLGELRRHHADREDPTPAEHVHEGRHVRRAEGELLRCPRHRRHGRSDPRLWLRLTTARSIRCSASSRRWCSTRS